MDQKEAIQNTEPENLKVTSSSITKNPSNTKFYLIATFIFLVIVSIAASFIYMNKNEPSPTVLQGKTIIEKGQNPSSGGGGGGATASGDDGKDEVTYPFRIFFVRHSYIKGGKIFSTKADGSDLQSHSKGANKSGFLSSKLSKSLYGKRLLFYDFKSLKSLDLIEDEVEDLGIKASEFSLSSDDTKIVYIADDNPGELLIYDIKSKKVELQKNFGTGTRCSAPQFISNNSEIILLIAGPNVGESLKKM
jgi:tricorn protease-like protein